MILRALAVMAQNKVKKLLAFSSIESVGYIFIGFSCEIIEEIQSLLIGVFIYVLMTMNVLA
jgi:NADH:ubiquinone oxidoreductase subunit 2 (subunit N)